MQDVFIGVDVSKADLVIAHHQGRPISIPNNASSIATWLSSVACGALIAMESTGQYHLLLAQMAITAGFSVFVLNARDVSFYAKALGSRAKSDEADCVVIMRYVQEHHQHLHPWVPATPTQQQLHDLLGQRTQVVEHNTALRQCLKSPNLKHEVDALQQSFKHLLRCIDAQIEQLIASDSSMNEGSQRLKTITGVGLQASAMLTELLSRIPFANADALVAYCGLDPRANDSGAKRGRRKLSKRGPARLRRQVYLMGFAASHSKALGPLYKAIRAKGFSSTEALVILGRKLLRVAFAVWKTKTVFDPARLMPQSA